MFDIASISFGPILIALIFGFIIGTRLHLNEENSFKFTVGAIIALIVGGFLMAYDIGHFIFHDMPIAIEFFAAILGVLIGGALLGGRAKGDH